MASPHCFTPSPAPVAATPASQAQLSLPDRGAAGQSDAGDTGVYGPAFTYPFLSGLPMLARPSGTSQEPLPKTIKIPKASLDKMTGMERQYWETKMQHYDVVVFWKKGKFYELYDGDAVLSHKEFGLKMTQDLNNRGKMRMSGVPEQSFSEWSRLFVHRGYRVGRVEQMTVDDAMIAANGGKEPKTIPRELVAIYTRGTVTDAAMLGGGDAPNFILSLVPQGPADAFTCDAVAVDLSRGERWTCPCRDATTAAALLHHMKPVEVIIDATAEGAAAAVRALVTAICPDACVEVLQALPASAETRAASFLADAPVMPAAWRALAVYFAYLRLDIARVLPPRTVARPDGTAGFAPYTAHLCGTAVPATVAATADGAAVLRAERTEDTGLEMDAAALEALELTSNLRDGTAAGSFYELLACGGRRVGTPMGRRRLRRWVLRPSAHPVVIGARQAAVQLLGANDGRVLELLHRFTLQGAGSEPTSTISASALAAAAANAEDGEAPASPTAPEPVAAKGKSLRTVDFERLLARLSEVAHADSRVAFVDPLVQYRKHLALITDTVVGYRQLGAMAATITAALDGADGIGRSLVAELLAPAQRAAEHAERFAVDMARVRADGGFVIPAAGECPEYDESTAAIEAAEEELQATLQRYKGMLGPAVKYSSVGKDIYLLEVPTKQASAAALTKAGVPAGSLAEHARTTKAVKFSVPALKATIQGHKDATTRKQRALVSVLRGMAAGLCEQWPLLFDAADRLAYLECLGAMAAVAAEYEAVGACCFPTFGSGPAAIDATGLCHPVVRQLTGAVVPNDVALGGEAQRVLLLTGPNMAGKSTLMRTVAIAVLSAQLGGPVQAQRCAFGAPVDRIFTRIGARDATHRGHSTLRVELEETATVHHAATARSMCLIDELGRGTSTHDGAAIAFASLAAIAAGGNGSGPLALFSTHYHSLAIDVAAAQAGRGAAVPTPGQGLQLDPQAVQLGYMDFRVGGKRGRDDNGADETTQRVVFLYKLVAGVCARSYGVEVAAKAGVPEHVLTVAADRSRQLQASATDAQLRQLLRRVLTPCGEDVTAEALAMQAGHLEQVLTKGTAE